MKYKVLYGLKVALKNELKMELLLLPTYFKDKVLSENRVRGFTTVKIKLIIHSYNHNFINF